MMKNKSVVALLLVSILLCAAIEEATTNDELESEATLADPALEETTTTAPVHETTPAPTNPKATDKELLHGTRTVKDWYINDACRRFPLWLGKLRAACTKHTGWAPQRPWWWLDEAHETLGSKKEQMEQCMETDFLEHMKTWPDCLDKANGKSPYCFLPDDAVSSIYVDHYENEELVTIKWGITPQEAFVVQSLAGCVRNIFPLDKPYFQKRAFYGFNDEHQKNKTEDYYLISGNVVTYMAGNLQMFAPGIAAQITNLALVAWEEAGWYKKKYGRMADPRTMGIRTTEHLSYQNSTKLNVHCDCGSNYTVLVALSDLDDYQGGEFRLGTNLVKFKPERFTAMIFRSALPHGVESILGGNRQMFATELWSTPDSPLGKASRPISDWVVEQNEISETKWKRRFDQQKNSLEGPPSTTMTVDISVN